jgi:hypothetical protein
MWSIVWEGCLPGGVCWGKGVFPTHPFTPVYKWVPHNAIIQESHFVSLPLCLLLYTTIECIVYWLFLCIGMRVDWLFKCSYNFDFLTQTTAHHTAYTKNLFSITANNFEYVSSLVILNLNLSFSFYNSIIYHKCENLLFIQNSI